MKYIASVSWGKDSLAMLYWLIEKGWPLDEVVSYDTGMEFKAIYNIRDQVVPFLKKEGIKFTELKPQYDFRWKMFEKTVHEKGGGTHLGYSWCGGPCRWGTADKLRAIRIYCGDAVQYVGIAADEPKRFKKARNEHKVLPLVTWGKAEADCLKHCYDLGYDWTEDGGAGPVRLYDILDRVSCWCCMSKNLRELKNMYLYLPDYWAELKVLQSRTSRPMKGVGKSEFELEERFKAESAQLTMEGFNFVNAS